MLGKGCFVSIHTFVFLFDSRNYARLMGVTDLVWEKQQQFKPTMLTTLVLSALCLSFIWMECEQQLSQQVVPAALLKTHFF